jgi:hypothetical protein
VTRSGIVSRPPAKLTLAQHHHLPTQAYDAREEYSIESAQVIAMSMCHINEMLFNGHSNQAHQFAQTYTLGKGLKKFGQKGRQAAFKEMKHLHDRMVFKPIRVEELLTTPEKRRAMESLIFLVEKRDGTIKGRTCTVQMEALHGNTWIEMKQQPVQPQ